MKMSAHSVVRLALCALLVTIHLVTPKVVAADDYQGLALDNSDLNYSYATTYCR